jgi:hypothetical protein
MLLNSTGIDVTGTISDADGNVRSGRKNLLINGGFDVWQRGTSFTSNKYTADRWYQWNSATSAIVTKETNGLHFVAQNSGSSLIEQRIENGSQFAGKTVTASVYIEGTPLNAYMFMYTRTGETGGSWQNTSSTNTLSSGLNTVTWDIPSGSGILILRIACDQTGDVDFTVSNAQLELGSTATEFEHRSYGEELALCQRYYETSFPSTIAPVNGADTTSHSTYAKPLCNMVVWAGSSRNTTIPFVVPKRVTPTMARYGNSQGYLSYMTASTTAPGAMTGHTFDTNLNIGSTTPVGLYINNHASGDPVWGVVGGWTADAEL